MVYNSGRSFEISDGGDGGGMCDEKT